MRGLTESRNLLIPAFYLEGPDIFIIKFIHLLTKRRIRRCGLIPGCGVFDYNCHHMEMNW